MTSSAIRQSFLDFFREKGHTIVPSSSLMPDSPNLLFTNAGMNQFVPIFLGERSCPYDPPRAADTQKCIRAGGKHNDLDDVGFDTYHHTFFEMLGNWSFGDYFKKEAIAWAWELVVERWGFPAARLYATVYNPDKSLGDPSEFDQEAWDFWAEKFRSVGLDPAVHIVNGNKKDNFWMMGETGPCGPCSELHVDLTPDGDTKGSLVNMGDARCIEIWNLIFIQYNANADGTFSPLPARHVDTGMGFERVTSIIQGTKGFTDFRSARISNYETDIFRPVFDAIEKLSGKKYHSTLPGGAGSSGSSESSGNAGGMAAAGSCEADDVAFRVIADHIRTLSFAIADGITPGNNDRNYVLRRILRRAVRYGRTLGLREPFFHKLVGVLADTMGDVFPELRARRAHVEETIRNEEESFNRTLDKGIELFETEVSQLAQAATLSGAFVFRLYDEQGFPLDLTEVMARERGLSVDKEGFEKFMEEQRARARASQKKEVIELSAIETKEPTAFCGYDDCEVSARVLEVVRVKDRLAVALDTTTCYAEMGGQVGDAATISRGAQTWCVTDTRKSGDVHLHFIEGADAPESGDEVTVTLDATRRAAIERNHTATHLLHWALHKHVSADAVQKGSYVGTEKLTFDFNHAALTHEQIRAVEQAVNEAILANLPVCWSEHSYAEIKDNPLVQKIFGEKYGDTVRLVQVGAVPAASGSAGVPPAVVGVSPATVECSILSEKSRRDACVPRRGEAAPAISAELCGGTHVRATGAIGLFRIVAESAIAAGVRRIEAITGLEAYKLAVADSERLQAVAKTLGAPLPELEKKLDLLAETAKSTEKALKAAQQRLAATEAAELIAHAETINDTSTIIAHIADADGDRLQSIAEALKGRFAGIAVLLGTPAADSVAIVAASTTPELAKKFPAGKIVSTLAPLVGGKGGGRPEQARGAGRQADKVAEAIEMARHLIGQ